MARQKRVPNIPNIILTLVAIAFLLILVFKYDYNRAKYLSKFSLLE